ncbi:MAG: lysostaphin resistance A-like protein [Clostridium fessum]
MGIAAPLSEELLFRGIIFERLRMALPFFWAALGSAAFFGLVHGNWAQGFMRRSWDLYWRGCMKKEPSVGTCVISQCSKFDGAADAGASLALVRT